MKELHLVILVGPEVVENFSFTIKFKEKFGSIYETLSVRKHKCSVTSILKYILSFQGGFTFWHGGKASKIISIRKKKFLFSLSTQHFKNIEMANL
jgi:hypothetical protein